MTEQDTSALGHHSEQITAKSTSPNVNRALRTTCCVVGGGPAGMMLGYVLACAGVTVTVMEKHADFFRDFRGDTVHPSTLEVLFELGLLEDFLRLPHQELSSIGGTVGDFAFQAANFKHVSTHCKFVALVPQWDFLNFLSDHAEKFPSFNLWMQHDAVDLIEETGQFVGVKVNTPGGMTEIRADLVVACDGRHSTMRRAANLKVLDFGVPMDVLWFRITRNIADPEQLLGKLNYGGALVLINRGEYFQVGFIIPKGSFEDMKKQGLQPFRDTVRQIAPYLGDRVNEVQSWDQIKLLTVQINRLQQWYKPGLLCIGDAAHAMSPAGGVGINLAVQDAVAAANMLAGPLKRRAVTEGTLAQIQKRREFPTRVTQFMQVNTHKVLQRVFRNKGPLQPPWQLKFAARLPGLPVAIARVIGVGIRPEHIRGAQRSRRRGRLAVRVLLCAGTIVALAIVFGREYRRLPEHPRARSFLDG
ncbi:MAG: FAD-dependent oxidoreductase [Bryobacteraceae bacterium]